MNVDVKDLKKHSRFDTTVREWVTVVYVVNPDTTDTTDKVVMAIKINKSKALSVREAMHAAIERCKEPLEIVKGDNHGN